MTVFGLVVAKIAVIAVVVSESVAGRLRCWRWWDSTVSSIAATEAIDCFVVVTVTAVAVVVATMSVDFVPVSKRLNKAIVAIDLRSRECCLPPSLPIAISEKAAL